MASQLDTYSGACGCGQLVYQLSSAPLFVHCCHCTECQKQTGSAYVLNALIEADRVTWNGDATVHMLATPSGKGQQITRCAACGTAVFSNYLVRLGKLRFVRVGTLDHPELCPPDVQIFTSSKQPWVPLSMEIPSFEKFYEFKDVWPADAFKRLSTLFET